MTVITHKEHQIPVIYLIRNKINGKVYVGQTVNLYKRYKAHEGSARVAEKYNRPLVSAFKKHGFSSFEFSILEELSKDAGILTVREQYWMDKLQSFKSNLGYNACPAAASPLGFKHTDETRLKVSIASSKRKMSSEARKKMSIWHTGKKLSKETKEKISKSKSGVKHGNTKGRKVEQLNNSGKLIAEYKSITTASISTGTHLGNISRSCKKTNLRAGGFYWRYAWCRS